MTTPTIKALKARAVLAPFKRKPVSASGAIDAAALVLIDLESSQGVTGHAYLFAFSEAMLKPTLNMVEVIAAMVKGRALVPLELEKWVRQTLRLLDTQGVLGQVIAGLDMAAWDAHAQAAGLPLATLLGGSLAPIPAYNSCGLWIQEPTSLAEESLALLQEGDFKAVKMRLGRADAATDLAAVRHVRGALPDNVHLMSDYNQSLSVSDALQRTRELDGEGLYWIEEPVAHDDYSGCARVARSIKTPIQIGENLRGLREMQHALAADAATYYMPDVQRIGGVSGWLKAAALAEAHSVDLSSHLFPEVSAHLLAASPTAHWLEYVDWANPILADPLLVSDGHAQIANRPGSGITWDEAAVKRYQVL